MPDARKKERQRLKRAKKAAELRKAKSVSIFKRIADTGQVDACYINPDWKERGQAVVYVLAETPAGNLAMAMFMIDLWCAGLKDAWGTLDITRSEFEESYLHRMEDMSDMTFERTDLPTIRRVVAGAIRFAADNGFRLPHKFERWTQLMGGVGDWHTADISDFGVDGKLRWVGPMHDLRTRLMRGTVDDFLARPDVEFITDDGEFIDGGADNDDEFDDEEVDDPDDDESAEAMLALVNSMAEAVKKWCFQQGKAPHPLILQAVAMHMTTSISTIVGGEPDDHASPSEVQSRLMDQLIDSQDEYDPLALRAAAHQVRQFVLNFPNPQDFLEATEPPETEAPKQLT